MPTERYKSGLGERIGDLATIENLAQRHARLWDGISFQLSFRAFPVPNSEGPEPSASTYDAPLAELFGS